MLLEHWHSGHMGGTGTGLSCLAYLPLREYWLGSFGGNRDPSNETTAGREYRSGQANQ
jgi:hypothetical protein